MLAPLTSVVCSVQNPLDEDHGDEVTEKEQEEHQLWDELQEYGVILGVVDFVPQTLIKKVRIFICETFHYLIMTPNVMWMTPKMREIFIL